MRLGLLPREGRRGVEHLDAARVVIARAAHELVRHVEPVEAAREDRPAQRGPELEDVVGLAASLPRDAHTVGGRRGRHAVRGRAVDDRVRRWRRGGGRSLRFRHRGGRGQVGHCAETRHIGVAARSEPDEHGDMSRHLRAAARRPLHVRPLDRRQPGPRPVRERDAPAARSGRLRAPPRRDRRVRRELPRRRPRAARLVGRRARADPQAVPARARQHRASRCRWPRRTCSRTRCSRKARSPPTIPAVRRWAITKTLDAIDMGVELGASVYVMWGGREGTECDAAKDIRLALDRYKEAVDICCAYVARPRLRRALRARAQAERAARQHPPADRRARARVRRAARMARDGRAQPRVRARDDVGAVVPPRGRADALGREAVPHRSQRPGTEQVRPGLPLRLRRHPRRVLPREAARGRAVGRACGTSTRTRTAPRTPRACGTSRAAASARI